MLEDIQKQITIQKPKMKLKDIVQICLDYISGHPEDINLVGIAWYDNNNFIINTKIFAAFTKRKINTINRNLRKNGLICFRTNVLMRQRKFGSITFNQLPDQKNWVIHRLNETEKKIKFKNNQKDLYDKQNEIKANSNLSPDLENIDLLFNLNDEMQDFDYYDNNFDYI